jgi:hypothetical protein
MAALPNPSRGPSAREVTMSKRTTAERVADARAKLENDIDVWVATATDNAPHLVPLSLHWDGERVILATESDSVTARSAAASGRVRLGLEPSRDVVMIDADCEVLDVSSAPALAEEYARRTSWDPRHGSTPNVFIVCRPTRIQVWRSVEEIAGRTIMRGGEWLA